MRSDPRTNSLQAHGIQNPSRLHWNLPEATLYEMAIRRNEGEIAQGGALAVRTGLHTGRSPNDKFIVVEPENGPHIDWGSVNRAIDPTQFTTLHDRLCSFLEGKELFVEDCLVGAHPAYEMPIRVISELAWHSLFARNLFMTPPAGGPHRDPEFTVIDVPSFVAEPRIDATSSGVFIIINLARKLVLIGGTGYAGEIKKAIFTVMNYRLPLAGVLSMHCSANIGKEDGVAVFFGLSGTGKTTLSADPKRGLIGDDEHGWCDDGIFNFEGGCYAKAIRLSREAEPEIYSSARRFGTILENVTIDPISRELDFNDSSLTENTRAAYPLWFIANAVIPSRASHPGNIVMLTCDAFGVLPPISKLTSAQAMYHFLSGYTAKVAGTEEGLGSEPSATFSTCFGAPFMVLRPTVYAQILGAKINEHRVHCWLVNTGWSGGPFGSGHRIRIAHTRAMIHAALGGKLSNVACYLDPTFGVHVPQACEGIPSELLQPKNTWPDPVAYDRAARELAGRFRDNFVRFSGLVGQDVRDAAPAYT